MDEVQKFYKIIAFIGYDTDMKLHLKSGNKTLMLKIISFIEEIRTEPKSGTGKPEQLKGFGERSVWSRRIDKKHRLIYEIFEDKNEVLLLSCYGHYDD